MIIRQQITMKRRFTDASGKHIDCMHKKILSRLIDPTSKTILEAGVGTGRFSTWLARRGFNVVGMDLSKEMLKKAKQRKKLWVSMSELVVADVLNFPFKDSQFDVCICINVMDHFSNIGRFFKEVRNVIKPKGSLVFNYSNIQSLYLPVALIANLRKNAFFKQKIYSHWSTYKEVTLSLLENGFVSKEIRSCMFASTIPFGEKIVKFVKILNFSFEGSKLGLLGGSVFIKAVINSKQARN